LIQTNNYAKKREVDANDCYEEENSDEDRNEENELEHFFPCSCQHNMLVRI